MEVYRIVLAKYAKELVASGLPNRWNSRNVPVIYTSCTRAMAVLENVVHRSGEGLQDAFRILTISVPDSLKISEVLGKKLPPDWHRRAHRITTQQIGDQWVSKADTVGLLVPSAIVPGEKNLLLNPYHPGFKRVKLKRVEGFGFDPRIKKTVNSE